MILPVGMLPLVLASKKARSAAPWLLKDLEAACLDGRHLSIDAERVARHALREVADDRETVRDSCGTTPSPVGSTGDPPAPAPHVHAHAGAGDPSLRC